MVVILRSSDGELFPVESEIAKQSVTIRTMLEDLGDGDGDDVIPLPNVTAVILQKVLQWATYHKDDPVVPEDDENRDQRQDNISAWDASFFKVDTGALFNIIMAANYLDIKGLLDVGCKIIANMMRGKSPEEIREIFNIKEDFTPAAEDDE